MRIRVKFNNVKPISGSPCLVGLPVLYEPLQLDEAVRGLIAFYTGGA